MLDELIVASGENRAPDIEDVWNFHGGIIYIGIRRFIYQTPTPENDQPAISTAVNDYSPAYFEHRGMIRRKTSASRAAILIRMRKPA